MQRRQTDSNHQSWWSPNSGTLSYKQENLKLCSSRQSEVCWSWMKIIKRSFVLWILIRLRNKAVIWQMLETSDKCQGLNHHQCCPQVIMIWYPPSSVISRHLNNINSIILFVLMFAPLPPLHHTWLHIISLTLISWPDVFMIEIIFGLLHLMTVGWNKREDH